MKQFLLAVSLILIAVSAWSKDATIEKMISTYKANEARFHAQYRDKQISGEATVTKISADPLGTGDIFYIGLDVNGSIIKCDTMSRDVAASLEKGQQVKFRGRVHDVVFGFIDVRDCTFTKLERNKQSTSEFPELPPIASNPKPNTSWPAYVGVTKNKKMTIYDAISKTSGLETSIEKLSGQKADAVWERLSGPQSPITVESGDAIFGSACMAHSCHLDQIVIYVRANGAIAIAFTDLVVGPKKGKGELYYFANFNSSFGIPKPVRKFIEDKIKTTPGLLLIGVETINGIKQVPNN